MDGPSTHFDPYVITAGESGEMVTFRDDEDCSSPGANASAKGDVIVAVTLFPFPIDAPPSLEKSAKFEVSDKAKVGAITMSGASTKIKVEEDVDMLKDPPDEIELVILLAATEVVMLAMEVLEVVGFTMEEGIIDTQAPSTRLHVTSGVNLIDVPESISLMCRTPIRYCASTVPLR